jgi:hypothetical protein
MRDYTILTILGKAPVKKSVAGSLVATLTSAGIGMAFADLTADPSYAPMRHAMHELEHIEHGTTSTATVPAALFIR